jgi:hypothetical protein
LKRSARLAFDQSRPVAHIGAVLEFKETQRRRYREEFYHWMLWSKLGIAPDSSAEISFEDSTVVELQADAPQRVAG